MQQELEYIYGKHAVAEAISKRPDIIKQIYLEPSFDDDRTLKSIAALPITPRVLQPKNPPRGVSAKVAHQGIIAGILPDLLLVPYKQFIAKTVITENTAFLVLGEVQDPHNVGAVIRSAAAFGLAGVLIPPHNQAPLTGTVIKVSAGMAFRIPIVSISNVNSTLDDLKSRGCWVYGLEGEGTVSLAEERFVKPSVFVLGNEGSGLREKTKEHCDDLLSIPIHPRCESLNAAAATAVVLATWSMQHREALHGV